MNTRSKQSIIAIFIVLLVAVGLAAAGSQGGHTWRGIPLFALGIGLAFLIQWAVFIPAYLQNSERFFDLTGSLTYITVVVLSLLLTPNVGSRSLLLAGLVIVWALRLGMFLFARIRRAGEDRRFREIKTSFWRFLLTWTLQGLWVSFSLAAALAAITAQRQVTLGALGWPGVVVWLAGFLIEVLADRQKSRFKANPENTDKFIQTGLWAWSRHPNYFGEIVLWVGIAIIAFPALHGWSYLTLVSPLFVTLLLTRISGVPMLEARADQKWGGQPEYEAYKAKTAVLIPRPVKSSK